MEVSVTVREADVKEEAPEVVWEEINVMKVLEAAKKGISLTLPRIHK